MVVMRSEMCVREISDGFVYGVNNAARSEPPIFDYGAPFDNGTPIDCI
jgi:hypothetical protein